MSYAYGLATPPVEICCRWCNMRIVENGIGEWIHAGRKTVVCEQDALER